ncbi:hypothetical protein [Amnibacterium kyonggiense]|uniref:hypothetical protein n=1 Tax=Amnibacterium kyonggiense TaxID=595671 RepID=UPI00105BE6E2|nr:hypothetical protein [Amnibacterium kyonggiense]
MSTVPSEVRIVSGAVAVLAVAAGVMSADWRLGIPIVVAISIAVLLRANAALSAGAHDHGELASIERVLREDEATYPVEALGFEVGRERLIRSVRALRARSVRRLRASTEPIG